MEKQAITKGFTCKKGLPVVKINQAFVVQKSNGKYGVYPSCNMQESGSFDEAPFIQAYEEWKIKREEERIAVIQAEKEAHERWVEWVSNSIDPDDLGERLQMKTVETATHWSELYNGKSGKALLIESQAQLDNLKLAIGLLNIKGEFGEAKHRAGQHYHEFTADASWDNIESYRSDVKSYLLDKGFWKDRDTEQDLYLEKLQEAINENDIDAVDEIMEEYKDIKPGIYDDRATLIISEDDLNSHDFCGYDYDVYTYSLAFKFDDPNSAFNAEENELQD